MEQPEFGKKLVEIRNAKGLTQDELAEKCKITVRTIQRIESGVVKPRAFTIKIISATLGFDFFKPLENTVKEVRINRYSNMERFTSILWYVKDLFNLKTRTMKKVTILSIICCSICIGLFTLATESKAQKQENIDYSKFTESNGRGIIYFFPRGGNMWVSNVKDTADYKIKEDLIQEYKNKIFLNGKFIGKALKSDTVILRNGEIIIKPSYFVVPSSYGKKIYYLLPKGKFLNMSVQIDTENFDIDNHHIQEHDYKISLDGVFQMKVQPGDSVRLYNGKIEKIE
jgi:transcriptional regulator with XRE-family HTH domain